MMCRWAAGCTDFPAAWAAPAPRATFRLAERSIPGVLASVCAFGGAVPRRSANRADVPSPFPFVASPGERFSVVRFHTLPIAPPTPEICPKFPWTDFGVRSGAGLG